MTRPAVFLPEATNSRSAQRTAFHRPSGFYFNPAEALQLLSRGLARLRRP